LLLLNNFVKKLTLNSRIIIFLKYLKPEEIMKYIIFIFALLSSLAFSQIQPSGTGTSGDPYIINTLENLQWVSENSSAWSSYFLQTSNIDASSTGGWNSGAGWSPIGNGWDTAFFGSYNGGGHTISGLTIHRNGNY
jgi:hypothetical protein